MDRSQLKLLQFIIDVTKPYRWWYFLIFQATIIASGYFFASNYAIKWLIDEFSASHVDTSMLLKPIVLFIAANVGHDLLWRLSEYAIYHTTPFVQRRILLKSYDYVQYHTYDYFQSHPTGAIISKLKGIYEGIEHVFANLYYKSARSFLIVLYATFSLLIIDVRVFLFIFIWTIIAITLIYPMYRHLDKLASLLTDSTHEVMGRF